MVSLRRFPAALKERIGILQARRKVAGVKDETLEMLHALVAELGDCAWYVAMAAKELGVPLSRVARLNLEKLASRKKRGVIGGSGDAR